VNQANPELIINRGAAVTADAEFNFNGGYISGQGRLRVGGDDVIKGTRATDKPTLGVLLMVGSRNGRVRGSLYPGDGATQPLVVKGAGNITVNPGSRVGFSLPPLAGQASVTAVSNGDGGAHTIHVNGGTITVQVRSEVFVGMGVDMQGGRLTVLPGGMSTGPLHFTGKNAFGRGLTVSGDGQVELLRADLTVDAGAQFNDGCSVEVCPGRTLTLGINAMSPVNVMTGGTFTLQGDLVAHGGFEMEEGRFAHGTAGISTVTVDPTNTFDVEGGELDITDVVGENAFGILNVTGKFVANRGKIVNTVDTRGGNFRSGTFKVDGDIELAADVVFSSTDLNPAPGVVNRDWRLLEWTGDRTGTFTFDLPNNWTSNWDDANKRLLIHEP
jgi:hypothetical protein